MSSHVWAFVVSLVLSPSSVSRASTFSHFYLFSVPNFNSPRCRERRALNPKRTRQMRSTAPWRCTTLSHIQDLLSDGKTPWEWRFGELFKGPIIAFGSLVEYYPISAKDQSRIHQFGKNVLLGLFLGYALYAGRIWKGDVLIADLEELETMDASEIYSKRLSAKEVIFPTKRKNSYFQSQMDESKPLEEIRTWEHPP